MINIVCGIDEAGRGPMIGPMVMAGVVTDERGISKLKELGVKDSKLLSVSRREFMFEKIKKIVGNYEIVELSPEVVDDAVHSSSSNLNWLEADTSIQIIKKLRPTTAILDCPSNNVEAYRNYVLKKIKIDKLIVEHKADVNYIVVGAASILAKVTRDRRIEEIQKKVGIEIGSGYPADPKTKEFLVKNYKKFPGIFRKSWASYKKVVNDKNQQTLQGF